MACIPILHRTRAALLLSAQALVAQTSGGDPDLVFFLLAEQSRTAFTVQGAGARAIGTGGAFIAVADDATAVSFNPAGLAQLLRPEFSVVGKQLDRRQDFQRFAGPEVSFDDSSSTDRTTSPDFWSFTLPWKHKGLNYTFQLSHQRIFDFGFRSDRTFNSRVGTTPRLNRQYVDQRGGVNLWSAALGAELTPRMLVGGSVNLWRGSWSFKSDSMSLTPAGAPLTELGFRQDNSFKGFNWSAGAIWRSEYLNLGAVYRSAFTADYGFTNSVLFEDYTGTVPDSLEQNPAQTFRLEWPESLGAGLGLHLHPRWLVTADWTRIRWSRTTIRADRSVYDGLNFFDLQAATRTPDIVDFHSGTEWIAYLGDRVVIPVRAGVFREPQPLVDRRTGEQRVFKGWTAGFGVKTGALTVDVAFKKSDSVRNVSRLQFTSTGATSYTVGEEDLDEKRVYLSLVWQMNPERVKKVLHWLFVGN